MENPQIILSELKRQADEQHNQNGEGNSLGKEISKLRRKLRNYEYQEKRLIKLFRHDEIAEDYILDEINKTKKDRQIDEEELEHLYQTKDQLAKLTNAEIKLSEFCARVHRNLDKCTFKDKRLALDALDVRVVATQEHADIKGAIPIDLTTTQSSGVLLTTAQTSA